VTLTVLVNDRHHTVRFVQRGIRQTFFSAQKPAAIFLFRVARCKLSPRLNLNLRFLGSSVGTAACLGIKALVSSTRWKHPESVKLSVTNALGATLLGKEEV
jgi:hypothetical protein